MASPVRPSKRGVLFFFPSSHLFQKPGGSIWGSTCAGTVPQIPQRNQIYEVQQPSSSLMGNSAPSFLAAAHHHPQQQATLRNAHTARSSAQQQPAPGTNTVPRSMQLPLCRAISALGEDRQRAINGNNPGSKKAAAIWFFIPSNQKIRTVDGPPRNTPSGQTVLFLFR